MTVIYHAENLIEVVSWRNEWQASKDVSRRFKLVATRIDLDDFPARV